MTSRELALALEQWVDEVTIFNHYEHMPSEIAKALPLVICEMTRDEQRDSHPELSTLSGYQQALVRARTATLHLMCSPEPSWTASQQLYDAVDALGYSLRKDNTLGGRVYKASKFYDAKYTPPEVEHADGTRARVATFIITVGELVEVTPT